MENYLTQPIQWIENEVYSEGIEGFIFRPYNTGGHKSFIHRDRNGFTSFSSESNYQWKDYNIRLATSEEKQWYLACEKAGKFVPKPEYSSLKNLIIW